MSILIFYVMLVAAGVLVAVIIGTATSELYNGVISGFLVVFIGVLIGPFFVIELAETKFDRRIDIMESDFSCEITEDMNLIHLENETINISSVEFVSEETLYIECTITKYPFFIKDDYTYKLVIGNQLDNEKLNLLLKSNIITDSDRNNKEEKITEIQKSEAGYCANCGKEKRETFKFCPNCGNHFTEE